MAVKKDEVVEEVIAEEVVAEETAVEEVVEEGYVLTDEKKELIAGYYAAKKNGYMTAMQPTAEQIAAVKEYQAEANKGTKSTQADIATW